MEGSVGLGALLAGLGALFLGLALWLLTYRNRPGELSERLPLLEQRRHRIQPLFRTRSDVLWFAFWIFFIGGIFLLSSLLTA
ncbi:MAG: hypothetical protein ACE5HD_09030 [Acidobacteriota bacterium]